MSTLAKRAAALAAKDPIMEGRSKIDSSEVVRLYGKTGFTVKEISRRDITDQKTGLEKHFYYVRIDEDDTVIISTGQAFTGLLDKLVDDCGSVEEFNAIAADDDFMLLPAMKRSANGNKYMNVTIMD